MTSDAERRTTLRAHVDGLATWGVKRVAVDPSSLPANEGANPMHSPETVPAVVPAAAPAPAPMESAPRDPERLTAPQPALPSHADSRSDSRTDSRSDSRTGNAEAPRAPLLAQQANAVSDCQRCRLCETRTQTVFGVGDPHARLMFVGEAPGADEDQQGEPFVGKAGQLLNKMIGAMGLKREEVYIANILKCRPPGNRDPLADETAACTPYLVEQIATIRPEVIVALGKPSSNYLLDTVSSLSRLRGRQHDYHGTPLYVTYHPAALLRNASYKAPAWEDLKQVMAFLGLPLPQRP